MESARLTIFVCRAAKIVHRHTKIAARAAKRVIPSRAFVCIADYTDDAENAERGIGAAESFFTCIRVRLSFGCVQRAWIAPSASSVFSV